LQRLTNTTSTAGSSAARAKRWSQFVEAIGSDTLAGRDSLVMLATTEGAAEFESRPRQFLIEHDHIDPSTSVNLHIETFASPGNLVQARANVKQLDDSDLNSEISNRQVFVIDRVNPRSLSCGSSTPRLGRRGQCHLG
jgi:hypothetical protein